MNFKLFIQNLYSRCLGILRSPEDEWVKIKDEEDSNWFILLRFILPLMLITVITSMIGGYIHSGGRIWVTGVLFISGLRPILSISLSIIISVPVINLMLGTYGDKPGPNRAAKLVLFTFIPIILVIIVLGLWPEMYFLGLFSLYSFYLMYFGTKVMTQIPAERQSNFSNLSSMMILVIYLIVNFVLSSFFGAIHTGG